MKRTIRFAPIIALAVIGLIGCSVAPEDREHIATEVRADGPSQGSPTLGMPYVVPGTKLRLVPMTLERPIAWLERSDRYSANQKGEYLDSVGAADSVSLLELRASASASVTKRQARAYDRYTNFDYERLVRWHNAILRDMSVEDDTGGTLVLDQAGWVTRVLMTGLLQTANNGTVLDGDYGELFFLATVEDTNADGVLTDEDANTLIAAGLGGNNPHRITPVGTRIKQAVFDDELKLLVILVLSDSDRNGRFTAADSAAPYIYKPRTAGMAKPLVDPALVEEAEKLLK